MSKRKGIKQQVFSYCDKLISSGVDIKDITVNTLVEKFPDSDKKTLSNYLSKYKKEFNSNVNIEDTDKQIKDVSNGSISEDIETLPTKDSNVNIVYKDNMTSLNGNVTKNIANIFDRLDIITKILEKEKTGDTSLPEIDYSEYKHFKDYKYSLSEELHGDFVFYAKKHGLSNRKAAHIALKLFCDACKGLNK